MTSKAARTKRIAVGLVTAILLSTFGVATSNAAVLWIETLYDTDSDFGVGYYSDIESITVGTTDDNYTDLMVLIEPYHDTALTFFDSGQGSLAFDTNLDGLDDFVAYAPSASLSAFSERSFPIYTGQLQQTGCASRWSMTSDYQFYAVAIPWTCLGSPAQTRVEAWMSNSFGYDFLNYGRTIYPILPAATTTTTTTLPPPPPTTLPPPETTLPPATLPLVATADTSKPGMVDDWIEYLVVKKPVSLTAVLNSSDCCYGVKTGTRKMEVLKKSKGVCVVKGKRLYPTKVGTCYVKVSVTKKGKKKPIVETVKFKIRKK